LSITSRLRTFYLSHLSTPIPDPVIYREICQTKARKIVEVGIGIGERSLRLIQLATEFHSPQEIHFTAIDLFEDRSPSDGPGISLREAHRMLKATGAKIQLVPGTPYEGFARIANMLGKVDAVILTPRPDAHCLSRTWFFIPRLLNDDSLVFLDTLDADGQTVVRVIDRPEVNLLAGALRRRAAA
jgi:hypothetical protein